MLLAAITTERDKMQITGILIANQRLGHGNILIPHLKSEMWGTLVQTWATRRHRSPMEATDDAETQQGRPQRDGPCC